MNNVALRSILIMAVSVLMLYFYEAYHERELSIEEAMLPINHLSDARHSIVNNNHRRAVKELDHAILGMKVIEKYADSASVAHIEKASTDLLLVESEIESDSLVLRDLNKAFFNALNSIAFACMQISENNLDKGAKYKSMRFMNVTFAEMIASLKFVNTEDLEAKGEKSDPTCSRNIAKHENQ